MFPSVTISFNPEAGALHSATPCRRSSRSRRAQESRPRWRLPSRATRRRSCRSLSGTPLLIGVALIVIYIILGVLYESFIHPITILSTLPSAGDRRTPAADGREMDLSVIAIIGIILLIGIVKKNGIILVDFALEVQREQGLESGGFDLPGLHPAVPAHSDDHDGSPARRRPLDGRHRHGNRSSVSRSAIRSFLLLSQVLTLYTTPVVFLYLDKLNSWFTNRRKPPVEKPLSAAAE